MHNQNHIDQAILECREGGHVAHCQMQYEHHRGVNRTVAIRPSRAPGKFNLTFSDPRIDLRELDDEIVGVNARQARRLIQTFFWGLLVHQAATFDLWINQADRECWIEGETATPTRVRIAYEMPNAGEMGSWCHATRLGNLFYVAT